VRKKLRGKRLHRKQRRGFQKVKGNEMSYRVISVLIVFLFFVAGCGEGTIPSSIPPKGKSPSVEKRKTEPTKVAEKKELEKKDETEYAYDSAGKADPFKPFIQVTSVRGSSRNVPLTPLEKYEISQLKLVAIISTPEGNIALIEDSAGKGYFLKKGTGIGKNDGRVKKILKDKVVIEETYQDILGQKKINEISLYLQRLEEGGES
jgi:type IV pilus assembly protein PilP